MSRMVQIRNVPEELHRELKARAAREGRSLSDYLLRELERLAARPPVDDVLARLQRRGRLDVGDDPPRGASRAWRARVTVLDASALLELLIVRYPHASLLERAFELRDDATVYDALYLALAEGLDCPLLTADGALATVPACRAVVQVLDG